MLARLLQQSDRQVVAVAALCHEGAGERASTLVTSNLPFNEWTEIFGSERLPGALLERLTHHVHPSCITQNTPRIFYEMPAGGLVLLRHNTAEHRRLVAYFLSAANTASNPLRKSFAFVTLT